MCVYGVLEACLHWCTATASALQAIFDLEATNQELKPQLRDLYITSAKELEFFGNARKAIVVHVRHCLSCASAVLLCVFMCSIRLAM